MTKESTRMFEKLTAAPPDAILGLSEAFKKDPNPKKINLGVGVYKDAYGKTPILATAKKAEQMLLSSESTKSYLPIDGNASYDAAAQALILGPDHGLANGRAVTVQTPGGTGSATRGRRFHRQEPAGILSLAQRSDLAQPPCRVHCRRRRAKELSIFRQSDQSCRF